MGIMARVMARQSLVRIYGALIFLLILAASVTFLISSTSTHRRYENHNAAEQRTFASTRRFLGQLQDQRLQQFTHPATVQEGYPRSGGPITVRRSIVNSPDAERLNLAANSSVPGTGDESPETALPIPKVSAVTEVPAEILASNHSFQPPAYDAVQLNFSDSTAAEETSNPAPLYSSVNSYPRYPQTAAERDAGKG